MRAVERWILRGMQLYKPIKLRNWRIWFIDWQKEVVCFQVLVSSVHLVSLVHCSKALELHRCFSLPADDRSTCNSHSWNWKPWSMEIVRKKIDRLVRCPYCGQKLTLDNSSALFVMVAAPSARREAARRCFAGRPPVPSTSIEGRRESSPQLSRPPPCLYHVILS